MKYRVIIFLLFVSALFARSVSAQEQSVKERFTQANNLFLDQKYKEAAKEYESIIKTGMTSGELLFNLGNAYFKMQQFGKAILYYERARRYTPSDEELLANLELANSLIADRITAIPEVFYIRYFNGASGLLSNSGWLIIMLLSFILANFAFSARVLSSKRIIRKILKRVIIVFAAFTVLSAVFLISGYREIHRRDYIVVQAEKTSAFSSPNEESENIFDVHEGTKAKIERRTDSWYEIKLADGKVGWIKTDSAEVI